MKKKIITLIAFVILTVTGTFAAEGGISKEVQATFTASFTKASEVSWQKENAYYKARFKMNGQSFNALISEEGKMIAVSRNILSTELPINLQAATAKNFSAYWISNLIEYAVGNETLYYITVENTDQQSVYESVGTYDWSLLKKTNK